MKGKAVKLAACAIVAMMVLSMIFVASAAETSSAGTPGFTKSTKYPFTKISQSIKQYKAYNPDITGWLIVPGTNINEPITYSNKSNSYYLYRDWAGREYPNITWQNWYQYPACATYLDARVVLPTTSWNSGSRNLVFYGHNWNNLRSDSLKVGNHEGLLMFAQLPSYTDPTFAQTNPYIYYSTENVEGIWKVFAVEFCEVSPSFPYNSPNPGSENFPGLVTEIKKRSMYNFNTDVNEKDRIITLSTCTREYNAGDNQRFAVFARLLREGESENDPVKLTVNSEYIPPKFNAAGY